MEGLDLKYFVLKPKGDSPYAKASRIAMLAYAEAISMENPLLCTDIQLWVEEETKEGE